MLLCNGALLHIEEVAQDPELSTGALPPSSWSVRLQCSQLLIPASGADQMFRLQTREGMKVQDLISRICERFWVDSRSERESLVCQTLLYLLVRCLQESSTIADLRRLFQMREVSSFLLTQAR